jgi:hypothetical protein
VVQDAGEAGAARGGGTEFAVPDGPRQRTRR